MTVLTLFHRLAPPKAKNLCLRCGLFVCTATDSDLDFDSTLLLMKKRQQLQQQLSMLEEAEKAEADEKDVLTVERQVGCHDICPCCT